MRFPPATAGDTRLRVGLVGAGYIAQFHLAALSRRRDARVVGVCDPIRVRAEALRRRWGFELVFDTLDEMLCAGEFDVVHVLVPPGMHAAVAQRCLRARSHVFVEKPLVTTAEDGRNLLETARSVGRRVGVNHNLLFHPAFLQMVDAVRQWRFGRIRHVISCWNVALRQLQSGQYDHWMFDSTGNVILEQAIHPLSQVLFLLGRTCSTSVVASRGIDLPTDVRFVDGWQVSLQCERGTATCTLNFGDGFPQNWLHVVGDDAAGWADFRLNTFAMTRQSRFSTPLNEFVQAARCAATVARQSATHLTAGAMELLRLRPDLFTRTIEASIDAFYRSLAGDGGTDEGAGAVHLVEVCEQIGRLAQSEVTPPDAMALLK